MLLNSIEKIYYFFLCEKKKTWIVLSIICQKKGFLVAKIRYFTAKHIYEILEIFPGKKNK